MRGPLAEEQRYPPDHRELQRQREGAVRTQAHRRPPQLDRARRDEAAVAVLRHVGTGRGQRRGGRVGRQGTRDHGVMRAAAADERARGDAVRMAPSAQHAREGSARTTRAQPRTHLAESARGRGGRGDALGEGVCGAHLARQPA
eukprot:738343-Prymnesium_polylepis.1